MGKKERHYQAIMPAPFGAVGIMLSNGQLVGIDLLSANHHIKPELLRVEPNHALEIVCAQLNRYFANPKNAIKLAHEINGTDFQRRVWSAIQAIPAGKTLTYTELAKKVGSGPRAVANACGANKLPLLIPCHRVVAKNGLGGFMQGKQADSLAVKRWLLAHEQRAA